MAPSDAPAASATWPPEPPPRPTAIRPPATAIESEEDRVEQHEEGQQRARGLLRLQAGAAQRPQRQRDAARATRRQQPRDGGAGQGDLGARAQVHPRRRALADQPQQRDVAAEGDDLEADGGEDPARIGVDRALQRVGEGVQRAAGQHEHRDGDRGGRERQRRAARERLGVEGGESEFGGRLGRQHHAIEYPEPRAVLQRWCPVSAGWG